MDDYATERARWIEEVGSARLRMALRMGLLDQSDKVYLEERRDVEFHGWNLQHELPVGYQVRDIRNPTLTMMQLLEERGAFDPDVRLVFIKWSDRVQPRTPWKPPVLLFKGKAALMTKFAGTRDIFLWVE
jgi:hypothetical protein